MGWPLSPTGRRAVARWALGVLAGGLAVWIGAHALARLIPLPERLTTDGSAVVLYRDGTTAHVFLAPDDRWRVPVALQRVDPDYVTALVALEDRRFWGHPGVDPVAIARATIGNLRAGQVESGASTITMQLVRVLEPRPRTLRSKGIEALRAIQLELLLSKEEVLEAYLTFVPYGRNIEGIEAASLAYFGHSADALAPGEIATLLAVPQDPNHRYPSAAHAPVLRQARDDIAARLGEAGALPLGEGSAAIAAVDVIAAVRAAPVPERLRPVPRDAPHAADWLRRRAGGALRVQTTLDRGAQSLAERTLAASRADLARQGVHNGSIVVVDHGSGDVRALIGNFDFWDDAHGGQIAGFDVPRSPGSALKPFIYASAIDRGLVLPDHLVEDVPVRYGGYAPDNFDGRFEGVVRAEDALSRSLNIPFVQLLQQVGVERFLGDLRTLGATHLRGEPGWYGLSVAAGGIELTPLEMAGLFAALAQDGRARTLVFAPGADGEPGPAVISPGAAWLTRRALALKDRPDFPTRRQLTRLPARIHWKTGTSFGYRDAWAVGSGPTHTVAVWLGNFDQSGTVHLVGAEAAGPVLFDLLEALGDARDMDAADPAPRELVEVEVCALSGRVPAAACPHRRRVLAREQRVPVEACPFHVEVEVDIATGLQVGPTCRAGRETRREVYVLWPPTVRRWLSDQLRGQAAPPALAPGCEPSEQPPPRIVSPAEGEVVLLIPGVPADRQEVPFEGDASRDAALSWFVDGELVGRAPPSERVWWVPRPGEHDLVVMDETGATAKQRLVVRADPP